MREQHMHMPLPFTDTLSLHFMFSGTFVLQHLQSCLFTWQGLLDVCCDPVDA